ncbi:hypothetical protein COOONC_02737 [Cooperia oncophora]
MKNLVYHQKIGFLTRDHVLNSESFCRYRAGSYKLDKRDTLHNVIIRFYLNDVHRLSMGPTKGTTLVLQNQDIVMHSVIRRPGRDSFAFSPAPASKPTAGKPP